MTIALIIYAMVGVFLLGAMIAHASEDPEANAHLLLWLFVACALWPIFLMLPGKHK